MSSNEEREAALQAQIEALQRQLEASRQEAEQRVERQRQEAEQRVEQLRQEAEQREEHLRQQVEEREDHLRQQVEQETARIRQQVEEETARIRQEAEQETARIRQEAKRRVEEERNLRRGTHYATFDEVWDGFPVPYSSSDYDEMIRNEFPSYISTSDTLNSRYQVTRTEAMNSCFDEAFEAPSRTSLSAERKLEIWPVDVLQSKFRHRNDGTKFIKGEGVIDDHANNEGPPSNELSNGDVTQLVPASPFNASLYHHVAIWVFGEHQHINDPKFLQKLIHGSFAYESAEAKEESSNNGALKDPPPQSPESVKGQQSPTSATGRRVPHTGLKHMICNKIKLFGQEKYFHRNPCLIIVPILSLQQAKEWNGQGYDAIFMISTGKKTEQGSDEVFVPTGKKMKKGSDEESVSTDSTEERMAQPLQAVAAGVMMQEPGPVANKSEIDLARQLLTNTMKGLTWSLREKSADTAKWVTELREESKEELNDLQCKFTVINGEKQIIVPIDRMERQPNLKPIRKITFSPAFGSEENYCHPAPDPLLLVVKSAVNWSWFHEQKLLATGERDDSDDSDTSEQSIAAMDEYLAMKKLYQRASRDEELKNMEISFQVQSSCS